MSLVQGEAAKYVETQVHVIAQLQSFGKQAPVSLKDEIKSHYILYQNLFKGMDETRKMKF